MKKELLANVDNLKKTAASVKSAVQTGLATSKFAAQKAGTVLNKKGLEQSVEVTSKGIELAAKGAKQLANTLEKASTALKKVSSKLKD